MFAPSQVVYRTDGSPIEPHKGHPLGKGNGLKLHSPPHLLEPFVQVDAGKCPASSYKSCGLRCGLCGGSSTAIAETHYEFEGTCREPTRPELDV